MKDRKAIGVLLRAFTPLPSPRLYSARVHLWHTLSLQLHHSLSLPHFLSLGFLPSSSPLFDLQRLLKQPSAPPPRPPPHPRRAPSAQRQASTYPPYRPCSSSWKKKTWTPTWRAKQKRGQPPQQRARGRPRGRGLRARMRERAWGRARAGEGWGGRPRWRGGHDRGHGAGKIGGKTRGRERERHWESEGRSRRERERRRVALLLEERDPCGTEGLGGLPSTPRGSRQAFAPSHYPSPPALGRREREREEGGSRERCAKLPGRLRRRRA